MLLYQTDFAPTLRTTVWLFLIKFTNDLHLNLVGFITLAGLMLLILLKLVFHRNFSLVQTSFNLDSCQFQPQHVTITSRWKFFLL